jgi:hypothetical protein
MPEAGPDPIIERVAAALSRPAPLGADFDARVMARVRAERPSMLRSVVEWLAEPRAVAVSPLGGLALAAGVAGLVMVGSWAGSARRVTPTASSVAGRPSSDVPVAFVFVAPDAQRVALAGDFNGWDTTRTPMVRSAAGLWTVAVPLAPGRYGYAFVVDGRRFVADPAAPYAPDDFGQPTSVITVSGPTPAAAAGGAL